MLVLKPMALVYVVEHTVELVYTVLTELIDAGVHVTVVVSDVASEKEVEHVSSWARLLDSKSKLGAELDQKPPA